MSIFRPLLVAGLLLAAGCQKDHGARPPIPLERFSGLYLDLLSATGRKPDSTAGPITAPTDSILKHWGVTAEDFKSTVAYYNSDPVRWREFFSEVIRKGTEKDGSEEETEGAKKGLN